MSQTRNQNKFSKPQENNASLLSRLYIYQKERFPILGHGLLVAAFSFSAVSYSRIYRHTNGFITLKIFGIGVFTTVSLFMLVRIFDEFKDADDDAKYRQELAVPRGLVSLQELRIIGMILVVFQVALNLIFIPKMLVIYFLIIAYLLLMGKEFFISNWLKRNQFWYVASHMFIIPFVDVYASGLDWLLGNVAAPAGLLFFFAVSYMNGIVLEIGRKIRIPEKESEGFLTYTSLLGTKRAVYLWLVVLLATLLLSVTASIFAGYGMIVFAVLSGVFLFCATPAILFLTSGTEKSSKMIEYASALWTISMYLTLGAGPMISSLLS